MALTTKQQRFIEAYTGNGTEAARVAGYAGSDAVLSQTAYRMLRKPEIAQAIKARRSKASTSLIATREDRQTFWSEVMNDRTEMMPNRLRAAELLGKSEADFVDRHEHKHDVSIRVIDPYAEEKKNG